MHHVRIGVRIGIFTNALEILEMKAPERRPTRGTTWAKRKSQTTGHRKENYVSRNYLIDLDYSDVGRRAPNVAAQQELGLLSGRRTGHGLDYPDHPAFAGHNLSSLMGIPAEKRNE